MSCCTLFRVGVILGVVGVTIVVVGAAVGWVVVPSIVKTKVGEVSKAN